MNNKKYASIDSLGTFLSNLKNIFASISHTHTTSDITDLDVQEIIDEVLAQLPDSQFPEAEGESF